MPRSSACDAPFLLLLRRKAGFIALVPRAAGRKPAAPHLPKHGGTVPSMVERAANPYELARGRALQQPFARAYGLDTTVLHNDNRPPRTEFRAHVRMREPTMMP